MTNCSPKYDEKYDVARGAWLFGALTDEPQVVATTEECERGESNSQGSPHEILSVVTLGPASHEPAPSTAHPLATSGTSPEGTTKSTTPGRCPVCGYALVRATCPICAGRDVGPRHREIFTRSAPWVSLLSASPGEREEP